MLTASLQREFTYLGQHKGDFFLAVLFLPLLGLLIWWIFSAGQPVNLPIAVVDHDQSSLSRQLTRLVNATPGVEIIQQEPELPQAIQALRQRKVYAVLVFPHQLEKNTLQGQGGDILLQLNAQYATYSSTIQRNIQQTVLTLNTALNSDRLQRMGPHAELSLATVLPIQVLAVPLYNDGPSYEVFLSATLVPAIFQILAMVLTVSALGRELRDGTAQAWLDTANQSLLRALLGKLLPYFVLLAFYGAGYIYLYSRIEPDSYFGSPWLAYAAFLLMLLASMSVSLLLVAVLRNFRMALSMAGFYSAPAFAYSGQAFPLVAMPELAQAWASILPLTHWIKIYNQLWLAGAPWQAIQTPVLTLIGLTLLAVPSYWLLQKYAFHPQHWGAR